MKLNNNLCLCGCNNPVTRKGNMYLHNHHWKDKKHKEKTKRSFSKLRFKQNPFKGKTHSKETKNRWKKNKRGENPRSEEVKEKIRNGNLGKKVTRKTRQKISKAAKKQMENPQMIIRLSNLAKKRNYKGKRNPNWRGGISKESYINFSNLLKKQIKERDGYKCKNPSCSKKYIQLHIHHIDYNKKNNKHLNLITLCISCNLRANYSREYWTKYYSNISVNC